MSEPVAEPAPGEKRLSQDKPRLSLGNAAPAEGEPRPSGVPRRSQGSTGNLLYFSCLSAPV